MKNTLLILSLSIGLTACGGGGSEETKAPAVATVSSTSTPANNPTGINAITVDNEFNLSTKYSLDVDVDLGMGDVRAYLNVCQTKMASQRADYNNCIYRGPLSNTALDTQLVLSNQDIELIAEIWFYDESTEPLLFTWQYEPAQAQQQFVIR
ncbi:hypothetical protein PS1M3_17780 [Pseudoalteromonas sp. PS1M3]|jgi:ABC-type glycerol-3-phosphate transport system substrate-binding protein|uniref:hypothetical protein n=1 Tax=Pseudoalteromonas sp. PS1M3 TaxID=87791 RepID=UPI000231B7E8|nr:MULTISPECIES: hypothetical protein [unclassified Pseudoalteromonas]MDA8940443.1 hypothetical protein [Pseudoalteromonas marina]BBW91691.1 hypothetical protein PS1M3_17780 [Pseudoalteromonas sp. PS1M3]GAA76284.1 hypothetical protein P20480_2757 [Pseudoalteromonas sp. BSi20480]|tara:strand:- start:133 stop:588 length:456 start_codon:yes stop_codon:yes gene_type:complete